ncbi:MAG TPA: hypothetical protein VJ885_07345 [Thermoanaerobaculia bacterium]|nr:hypothetical protein [Thermoanaerobaculia bacterium]
MLDDLGVPDHVRAALDRGELWRAKEILQGRIGGGPYDPLLYEQYGAVLLEMRDLREAGKYLFLGGSWRPEYQPAIALFLDRHRGGRSLLGTFPARSREIPRDRFPEPVRAELIARGVPEQPFQPTVPRPVPPRVQKVTNTLSRSGCLLLLGFAVASVFAGAPDILRWLSSLWRWLTGG